ncbi:MAG: hypothetical protein COB04_16395 [Gammaproteobacteria bacterium]|nr:MAG: hypothetical protein COB04_16395 [Gammaproteobacteria bacterium]
MPKLNYSQEELLAQHEYTKKFTHKGKTLHGGLTADGIYHPPRSLNRIDAIENWTDALRAKGKTVEIMDRVKIDIASEFFPSEQQAKLLLKHGCKDAMTRILTIIGVVEGFGNDGIKLLPPMEMQKYFVESVDGTCLSHLHKGLLVAHGNDEAGSSDELGHDSMWYALRDKALDNPLITDDMFENLPMAPPPGYKGKAKAAESVTQITGVGSQLFPQLDMMLELTLMALARILHIEYAAYATFHWAQKVLSDPEVSSSPEWAPNMVGYIQEDEDIHVGYLRCALAETRARTLIAKDGSHLSGEEVIDTMCDTVMKTMGGDRREKMLAHRYKQVLRELEGHPDGERILAEFKQLGAVPALKARSPAVA